MFVSVAYKTCMHARSLVTLLHSPATSDMGDFPLNGLGHTCITKVAAACLLQSGCRGLQCLTLHTAVLR